MSQAENVPRGQAHAPYDPDAYNPFDGVEVLPGLGIAVLWVVLSYVLVGLLVGAPA